ncbi:insulinase family protein [Pontibacter sp. JAM-7]|uniref:insulinase family protein n=1 Tax=Pontibacter sp. JAM-7 TaxID=3366581 RepID=UPI003AF4DC5C
MLLMRAKRFVWLTMLLLLTGQALADVNKSPNDPRNYRALTLNNALQVLLISDPSSDKAAASMNVAIGSSANPEARAGLAHFLEHMLFLGTEKYPTAGEYQQFIQANGGSHNAFTAQENTNYFFDVKAEALEPTLDRFAQFFIAPLFSAEYVDRERHAVDSEYQAKIRDDGRRTYAAGKQALNPQHSYSRFNVGSLETLADRPGSAVRDDLIAFYNQYYSANQMALVVLGRESLDDLEKMVRKKFSTVKNRQLAPFIETEPLFLPEQLPRQLNVQTLKDNRNLSLTFPMPETRSLWRQKPLSYISDLIGYEGAGSLLSLLKQRGWATGLAASPGHDLPQQASFMAIIQLTPAGFERYQEVVALFFDYIELMQQQGIKQALYDEMRQLSQIAFRFRENGEPIHEVSRLSQQLQRYPAEQVIAANYIYEQFDGQQIQTFLQQISPENMLLTLSAPEIATDQVETHYQTPYQLNAIPEAQLAQYAEPGVADGLSIRPTNPFVATDLSLQPADQATSIPYALRNEPAFDLWYQLDKDFRVPRANLYFTVKSQLANHSAKNWLLTSLYTQMLTDRLNETLYDALLAGLNTDIYPHLTGFTVRLSGYNDKLELLLQQVAHTLSDSQFDRNRFERLKLKKQQQLENQKKNKPFNQTNNKLVEMLLPQWSREAQLDALADLKINDLSGFVPKLLAQPQVRVLAHGNLSASDAKAYADILTRELAIPQTDPKIQSAQIVKLPENQRLVETLNIDHNDAAVSLYLQAPDLSTHSRAAVAVLHEILAAPFYSELRTEQQLGYIVFATPIQLRDSSGIGLIVQSPNSGAVTIESAMDAFLDQWQKQLASLPPETLTNFKNSVISRVMQQENSLTERSQRYWRELDLGATGFDRRQTLQQAILQLDVQQLQQMLTTLRQRTLLVRSFGIQEGQSEGTGQSASKVMQQHRQESKFLTLQP